MQPRRLFGVAAVCASDVNVVCSIAVLGEEGVPNDEGNRVTGQTDHRLLCGVSKWRELAFVPDVRVLSNVLVEWIEFLFGAEDDRLAVLADPAVEGRAHLASFSACRGALRGDCLKGAVVLAAGICRRDALDLPELRVIAIEVGFTAVCIVGA